MAEHYDLKLFGVSRSEEKRDKLKDPLQGNVNDGQEHGFSSTEKPLFYADRVNAPHKYDLGYFDDETCRLELIENPFGPKVLPIRSE